MIVTHPARKLVIAPCVSHCVITIPCNNLSVGIRGASDPAPTFMGNDGFDPGQLWRRSTWLLVCQINHVLRVSDFYRGYFVRSLFQTSINANSRCRFVFAFIEFFFRQSEAYQLLCIAEGADIFTTGTEIIWLPSDFTADSQGANDLIQNRVKRRTVTSHQLSPADLCRSQGNAINRNQLFDRITKSGIKRQFVAAVIAELVLCPVCCDGCLCL